MNNYSQTSRSWIFIGPLALMCCFGVALFLISSTIILSIIPTYLPIRDRPTTSSSLSAPQSVILGLSSGNSVPIGSTLSTENQNSIQNQMQAALTADSSSTKNVPTITVLSATGTTSSGRKKRQSTSTTNQILVIYQLLFPQTCQLKGCQTRIITLVNTELVSLVINIGTTSSNNTTSINNTTSSNNSTTVSSNDQLTGDIDQISKYWGNLRPYMDNPPNYFGVNDTGLPDECQVEQAHVLHRHGSRYPTNQAIDGANIVNFTQKLSQILSSNNSNFTGSLTFLNTWSNRLTYELLMPAGAAMIYKSSVDFWDTYGRILYNAQPGQRYYNQSGQSAILLRCNTVSRIYESALHWAEGFFGLYATNNTYSLLSIPASPGVNNTLDSNINCPNSASTPTFNQTEFIIYRISYLTNATKRISQYAPLNANLTVNDVFTMQLLCIYEYSALGSSDFCSLFTLNEWYGFEQSIDILFYKLYSFGSLTGRALGLGYLEELIARLNKQYITVSDSSVNSTLDSSSQTFPLNQSFYLDMSSDIIITFLLTALSLDYFRENLTFSTPLNDSRHFRISNMVLFGARLITEKIGCISSSPTSTNSTRTQYSQTQYGYSSATATNKFIRMRLNNGILPLDTIRGGFCSVGRTDGLCPMNNFISSQKNASVLANYQYVCYGNYTYNATTFTGDGTTFR